MGCGFFVVITYIVVTTIPTHGVEPYLVTGAGESITISYAGLQ